MKTTLPVRRSRAAGLARIVGALGVPVLALAALGTRFGIVPPEALVPVLVAGFALGLITVVLGAYALVDIWNSGAEGAGAAIAGIVYALPVIALLGVVAAAALYYPRVTDVTTDAGDPPVLESPGDPAAAGSDAERFALQGEAYPDLAPHVYPLPIADVYSSARAIVDDRGWTVVREVAPPSLPANAAAPSARPAAAAAETEVVDAVLSAKSTMTQSRGGRIAPPTVSPAPADSAGPAIGAPPEPNSETATLQAVARTFLFGFADDVVLRLEEVPQGTRVDMRSASGMGLHDLGQNARRVRRFLSDLDVALQPDPNKLPPAPPADPAPVVAAQPDPAPAPETTEATDPEELPLD